MTTDFVIPFAMKEKKEQATREMNNDKARIQREVDGGTDPATALIMPNRSPRSGVSTANMEAGGV